MKKWYCPYLKKEPELSRCIYRELCRSDCCVAFRFNIGLLLENELSELDLPGAILVPCKDEDE